MPDPSYVHLREQGVSLLLQYRLGHPVRVVHWGADLGDVEDASAEALAAADLPAHRINDVDHPVLLTLPVSGHDGYTGHPGLSGSRDGRDWSPNFVLHRPPTVASDSCRLSLADEETQLRLDLTVTMYPGGLVGLRATLTNDGPQYNVQDLVLALPVPARADELLDLAGRWGRERVPQRRSFTVGTHLREQRRGRTGADAATVLHAGTGGFGFAGGEVWAVHTAWSGNHVHYAEFNHTGYKLLGGGELLLPGEILLAEGESYRTPEVFASYGVGLDEVAARFHAYQRGRDRPVDTHRPVTLNVWEAVYFDHDLTRLCALAERAAQVGVERFVLDDGWFGSRRDDTSGLGDWVVSKEAWPNGLGPLVDKVAGLGMQFGLWFEPEMVNPDSDVARAHPERILAARDEWPAPARHQQVLNLAVPECFDHVLTQMSAVLSEYAIGYIKWDHNRDLVEAGDRTHGGRPAVHDQTLAVYRLMAEVKRRFPQVEIESCSSGGGRVDLAVLRHTDRVWVSDNIDPHDRQEMLRWTSQLVPPEYQGSHIASGRSHTTGRTHDLNFRAATAVFGHLGVEWDLTAADDTDLAELGAWIAFYRAGRDLLLSGTTIRLDGCPDGVMVHGVVSPDRERALFAYVLLANPLASPTPRLVLRGLRPQAQYRLRPRLVGTVPSGLVAPPWWGKPEPASFPDRPGDLAEAGVPSYPGVVLPGAALMHAGVMPPRLHPDQAVIFEVTQT